MAEIATAVASEAATKVTETVYESISQKISYVFKYQSHIEKPKEQVEKLRSRRQDVEADVDVAERQGEEIYNEVKDWLRGVEGFMERVAKLVDDEDKAKRRCFKGLCPDLIKRYRLSEEAEKVAEDGAKLLGNGNFARVSHPPILQRTESIFVGEDYESFDSRESNFQDVMEALKDSTVNMIGVYGMGGVGKTTLAKKVAWKAKEDNLYDDVAFAEVTETPDLKQIQADIASQLGMVFRDEESLYGRADQLRHRLKKAKRILVIVDNIWEKIDLKVVGIPFSYDDKGVIQQDEKESSDELLRCTILLTARTLVILNQMKTQKNVFVEPLADDDARNLFGNIVGDLTDKCDVAAEIIRKCAGLPLAITTIANALKDKSDSVWRDALCQLKSSNPRCVPEMNNTLYSTIELSYALLNSEEAKSLLLLCALFKNRHVSLFLLHGMGLGLFKDVYTIKDGRNRIKSLIDYLEASCLLLKGNNNEMVKMHEIVHLVVASIAKEKRMLNIQDANGFNEVLVKGMYKDSIAMSLPYRDIDGLPERVNFPNLELFTLYLKKDHFLQIPNHFFEGMKELKVLDLKKVHLLPLPSSFLCLTNLQTLYLVDCTLGDITMIGELRNLEILCFLYCDFEQLPERFKQLKRLKLLQLTNCPKLKVITPNVIASLSRLEELYIYNSFERWEVEGQNNASLAELKRLSMLNTLCIHISNLQIIQQDFIPENLEKYKVHIGDAWKWSYEYETSRTLRLKFNGSFHLRYGVEILVEKAKYLYLDQLDGVKDILWELDREGFPQLKHLSVQNSFEILYIVNSMGCIPSSDGFPSLESLFLINLSSMEKICCGLVNAKSFNKLGIIKVEKCDRLRYLFSSSMAENISHIQEIEVTDCKELKEVFGQESADHVDENERNCKVEFKQLHSLVLQCLPQFISFGLKVVVPRLENLKLSSVNIENIWIHQPQPMSSCIQCIKSLTVEECNGLKFMFSSSMVKSLVQLRKLVICNCKLMEVVIFDSEGSEGEDKIIDMSFPKLFYLKLVGLPKLTRFGTGNSIEFPTLNELHIESCSNLKTLFRNSFDAEMLGKELDEVTLEKYITDVNPLFDEKVAFPSLEKMILLHLDNLQFIWKQLHKDSFSKLKEVRVEFCEKMMTIVPSNSTQPLLTFHNLETLTVKKCWNMKSLFPVSVAIGLLQLKKLMIVSCGLEEIVAEEEVDGTPRFSFPQLTFLKLDILPNLQHFYPGLHTIEWPILKQLFVYDCEKIKVHASDGESQPSLFSFEKVIPNLEWLGLNADNVISRCLDCIPVMSFRKLNYFRLVNCDNEAIAFWFGVLKKLFNLETLYLSDCTLQKLDSQVDIFLPNLQTLRLQRCHRLKYLMSSSVISFKNIKNLEVHCCNGLANILACSAVRTLVHLTIIQIKECKLVTEVIAIEVETTKKEIVFNQLKILELYCLPSLTSFCSANYVFEFPCLEQVIVSQCPNLKIFSHGGLDTPRLKRVQLTEKIDEEYLWKDDLNSTIHKMFKNMVGFRNLQHLKLSKFPTLEEKVWKVQVPFDLFYNLKSLVLDVFLDTLTAIPSSMLNAFKNLETLEVRDSDSLKEVFDMDTQQSADGHTSKKSNQEALDFNNLKSLKVHNCCNLRHIFTPSIILGLAQLQEIEVKNCALIEEIITTVEETEAHIDEIRIPQLNSIVLESLPNLTSFCVGINILECPALKAITITKCPEIETFIFTDTKHQSDQIAPIFSKKVAFPSLEKMILLHLDNLQLIWHNQLHGDSFSKLKEVRVEFCEKLMTIVSSNSAQGLLTFHNLETLTVKNCWNMKSLFPVSIATGLLQLKELKMCSCGLEEIVANEEVDGAPRFLFPQLTFLKLDILPKLQHFYPGLHTIEWPMLKKLLVYKCRKIKVYASDGESQPSLFSFEKVIPNLEWLGLNVDNVTSRCLDCIPAMSFRELKFFGLVNCDNEAIAFWFGVLKKLYHLESFYLGDCTLQELDYQVDTFLPNLQTLTVQRCHLLKYLMPSSTISFKNLKSLKVFGCNGLVKILACSTTKTLVNLTTIQIKECKLVTEVIAIEVETTKEIVFSQLKILELHCLPSLTCFCSADYAFEFPCLEQVIVSQCPNLTIFSQGGLSTPRLNKVQLTKKINEEYFWKDDLNSTMHQMFTNMVGFRKFEHLNLCEFLTLKENIWNGKVPIDLFCNLKSLVLDGLSDSATIIPSNVLSYFKNVETIEVKSCDSLKEVFDMEEQLDYGGLTTKRSHHEILGFKNLKSVKVENCNNLRYIFTASLVSSLMQLEQIEIKSCALVEEIITQKKDAVIDKIKIPLLKSINLESLPNLTSFYSRNNILECPPLKTIIIKDCQNIHLKDFSLYLPSLFSENVVFPTMDDLTLSSIISEWIWQSQLPATSSCFQKLTILVIDGFDHLKYFFSSSMVKSLFQLKELEISNCKLVEGIIVEDEERMGTLLFPKLYQLKFRDLPKLTTFCNSSRDFVELPSLFRLWIDNCPGMKSFVSNSIWSDMTSTKKLDATNSNEDLHAHMQSLFDKKVRLPCLERLVISYADELVKIWDDQVSLDSFYSLNRVFVRFCKKLVNVFPPNMHGRHPKLEMLEVQNCDSIKEIFGLFKKRSGTVEEIVANEEASHRFVFSKLTRLYLQMLPCLKSFYPKIHISEWPVLDELKVYGCNNVETLASEFLTIKRTHGQSQKETPYQKPLFLVYKDAFPRLEELELCEMPRLLNLWRGNPQPNNVFQNLKTLKLLECDSLDNSWSSSVSFQNLVSLQVSKCDGLRYLLSFSKAKTLKWLTSINISECKKMDRIISNLEGEVVEDSIAFNNLNNLEIQCLPSLTSFCGGDISLEFPSLKKVIVKQCLKMETFSLGVLSTPKLQTLQLIEGEDEVDECGEGNPELNSAIQQLFNKRNVQSSKED